jgi:hypothetical protein
MVPRMDFSRGVRTVLSERTSPDTLTFALDEVSHNSVSQTYGAQRSFIDRNHSSLNEKSMRPILTSMTIEVRAMIHLFHLLDTPDEDILTRPASVYGEGIVNLKTVQRGPQHFAMGKQTLTMNRGQSNSQETEIPGNKNHN